jgi:hypothetical protein
MPADFAMNDPPRNDSAFRAALDRRGVEHRGLHAREAITLCYALGGWHVTPGTPAISGPITGRVWLTAAVGAHGRYRAPEAPGHAADLEDGRTLIDSIVLMAIVQRHFLTPPQPGWGDRALAEQLGVGQEDFARAQRVLDHVAAALRRPAAAGRAWWLDRHEPLPGRAAGGAPKARGRHRQPWTAPMPRRVADVRRTRGRRLIRERSVTHARF